jgi:hypothetical protein
VRIGNDRLLLSDLDREVVLWPKQSVSLGQIPALLQLAPFQPISCVGHSHDEERNGLSISRMLWSSDSGIRLVPRTWASINRTRKKEVDNGVS